MTERELDEHFGSPRYPNRIDLWESGGAPASLRPLDADEVLSLSNLRDAADCELVRHAAVSKSFIWAVDVSGKTMIAVEELAPVDAIAGRRGLPRRRNLVHPVEERKLGHPCLVGCGEARIAGELFLRERNGVIVWYMNVSSGRYCHENPPTDQQIRNAAAMFLERGLSVEVDNDF